MVAPGCRNQADRNSDAVAGDRADGPATVLMAREGRVRGSAEAVVQAGRAAASTAPGRRCGRRPPADRGQPRSPPRAVARRAGRPPRGGRSSPGRPIGAVRPGCPTGRSRPDPRPDRRWRPRGRPPRPRPPGRRDRADRRRRPRARRHDPRGPGSPAASCRGRPAGRRRSCRRPARGSSPGPPRSALPPLTARDRWGRAGSPARPARSRRCASRKRTRSASSEPDPDRGVLVDLDERAARRGEGLQLGGERLGEGEGERRPALRVGSRSGPRASTVRAGTASTGTSPATAAAIDQAATVSGSVQRGSAGPPPPPSRRAEQRRAGRASGRQPSVSRPRPASTWSPMTSRTSRSAAASVGGFLERPGVSVAGYPPARVANIAGMVGHRTAQEVRCGRDRPPQAALHPAYTGGSGGPRPGVSSRR